MWQAQEPPCDSDVSADLSHTRQGAGCLTPSQPHASPLGARPIHQEEDFSPHPFSHRLLTWKYLTN